MKCEEKWQQTSRKVRSIPVNVSDEVPVAGSFPAKAASFSNKVEPEQATTRDEGTTKAASDFIWSNVDALSALFDRSAEDFSTYRFQSPNANYLQKVSMKHAPAVAQRSMNAASSNDQECRYHHHTIK